jgi:hypothetical protein
MNTYFRTPAAILAALALCACAATSQNLNSKPASAAATDPNCLAYTGSNITPAKSSCRGFGRSYSNADIERTGTNSAGDALAQLDPSITVHR